jgi:hypothetical protein
MIAPAILLVVVSVVLSATYAALRLQATSRQRATATFWAKHLMDVVRNKPYDRDLAGGASYTRQLTIDINNTVTDLPHGSAASGLATMAYSNVSAAGPFLPSPPEAYSALHSGWPIPAGDGPRTAGYGRSGRDRIPAGDRSVAAGPRHAADNRHAPEFTRQFDHSDRSDPRVAPCCGPRAAELTAHRARHRDPPAWWCDHGHQTQTHIGARTSVDFGRGRWPSRGRGPARQRGGGCRQPASLRRPP